MSKSGEPNGERLTQTALERGIEVLRAFTTVEHSMTSKALAERTGLPKPTLFRITSTLRQLGLLHYEEETGAFRPTVAVLAMGAPVLARLNLRQVARPLMRQLADFADALMMISMGEGLDLVVVDTVMGGSSVVFQPEIGARLSLSRSAVGRAYLLSRPAHEQETYLARIRSADRARYTQVRALFDDTAQHLAETGFCKALGEIRPDTWGVAAPMASSIDGRTVVFSCSVLPFTAAEERMDDLGRRLVALVHNVEALLGNADHLAPLHYELGQSAPQRSPRRRKG